MVHHPGPSGTCRAGKLYLSVFLVQIHKTIDESRKAKPKNLARYEINILYGLAGFMYSHFYRTIMLHLLESNHSKIVEVQLLCTTDSPP